MTTAFILTATTLSAVVCVFVFVSTILWALDEGYMGNDAIVLSLTALLFGVSLGIGAGGYWYAMYDDARSDRTILVERLKRLRHENWRLEKRIRILKENME